MIAANRIQLHDDDDCMKVDDGSDDDLAENTHSSVFIDFWLQHSV